MAGVIKKGEASEIATYRSTACCRRGRRCGGTVRRRRYRSARVPLSPLRPATPQPAPRQADADPAQRSRDTADDIGFSESAATVARSQRPTSMRSRNTDCASPNSTTMLDAVRPAPRCLPGTIHTRRVLASGRSRRSRARGLHGQLTGAP